MTKTPYPLFLLFLCLAIGNPNLLSAQTGTTPQNSTSDSSESPVLFGTNVDLHASPKSGGVQLGLGDYEKKPKKKKKGEFAVAPIPMVNPSIGNGGGLGVLYATRIGENDASPPSTFGFGGFGTGTGSWGIGLGARLYLKDDKYQGQDRFWIFLATFMVQPSAVNEHIKT